MASSRMSALLEALKDGNVDFLRGSPVPAGKQQYSNAMKTVMVGKRPNSSRICLLLVSAVSSDSMRKPNGVPSSRKASFVALCR
jgi:hypothetical protein